MKYHYSVPVIQAGKILQDKVFHGKVNYTSCRLIAYYGYFKGTEDVRAWRKSFIGAFLSTYPEYPHIIRYVAQAVGKKNPIWNDLTTKNLEKTVEIMKEHLCQNSVKVCTARLKATLNKWSRSANIPRKIFNEVLLQNEETSRGVFLNEEDIAKLETYLPETEIERNVQARWLCEYYLGISKSDFELLYNNKIDEKNRLITYDTPKGACKTVTVPLPSNFMKFYPFSNVKKYSLPMYHKTIREVCRKAGIINPVTVFTAGESKTGGKYEFVVGLTARRSFACNMFLKGVDMFTIAKMMGHSSIVNTERFLVLERNDDQFSDAFLKMYYK